MILDIIFLVAAVWGFWKGWSNGLINSAISLISMFAGVILALKFGTVAAEYLQQMFNISPQILPIVSFAFVFIAVLVLLRIIGSLLDRFAEAVMLGGLNKMAGAALWFLLATFLVSTVFWFVDRAGFFTDAVKMSSVTYDYVQPVSPVIVDKVGEWVPGLGKIFENFTEFLDSLKAVKDFIPGTP